MILVIDNYDSFVHNLARHVRLCGAQTHIVRNNAIDLDGIDALNPRAIILSPGPCGPADAGICLDAIRRFGQRVPILGVCLGHQAIAQAYGGAVTASGRPCHGMASAVRHDGSRLFAGVPSPFMAGRYHSLVTAVDAPSGLRVTAQADDGTIMAFQHENHPVYGVQFHPESVLTEGGLRIVQNFVELV